MSFKGHRKRISAYRKSGRMFGETFSSNGARERVEEMDALTAEIRSIALKIASKRIMLLHCDPINLRLDQLRVAASIARDVWSRLQ